MNMENSEQSFNNSSSHSSYTDSWDDSDQENLRNDSAKLSRPPPLNLDRFKDQIVVVPPKETPGLDWKVQGNKRKISSTVDATYSNVVKSNGPKKTAKEEPNKTGSNKSAVGDNQKGQNDSSKKSTTSQPSTSRTATSKTSSAQSTSKAATLPIKPKPSTSKVTTSNSLKPSTCKTATPQIIPKSSTSKNNPKPAASTVGAPKIVPKPSKSSKIKPEQSKSNTSVTQKSQPTQGFPNLNSKDVNNIKTINLPEQWVLLNKTVGQSRSEVNQPSNQKTLENWSTKVTSTTSSTITPNSKFSTQLVSKQQNQNEKAKHTKATDFKRDPTLPTQQKSNDGNSNTNQKAPPVAQPAKSKNKRKKKTASQYSVEKDPHVQSFLRYLGYTENSGVPETIIRSIDQLSFIPNFPNTELKSESSELKSKKPEAENSSCTKDTSVIWKTSLETSNPYACSFNSFEGPEAGVLPVTKKKRSRNKKKNCHKGVLEEPWIDKVLSYVPEDDIYLEHKKSSVENFKNDEEQSSIPKEKPNSDFPFVPTSNSKNCVTVQSNFSLQSNQENLLNVPKGLVESSSFSGASSYEHLEETASTDQEKATTQPGRKQKPIIDITPKNSGFLGAKKIYEHVPIDHSDKHKEVLFSLSSEGPDSSEMLIGNTNSRGKYLNMLSNCQVSASPITNSNNNKTPPVDFSSQNNKGNLVNISDDNVTNIVPLVLESFDLSESSHEHSETTTLTVKENTTSKCRARKKRAKNTTPENDMPLNKSSVSSESTNSRIYVENIDNKTSQSPNIQEVQKMPPNLQKFVDIVREEVSLYLSKQDMIDKSDLSPSVLKSMDQLREAISIDPLTLAEDEQWMKVLEGKSLQHDMKRHSAESSTNKETVSGKQEEILLGPGTDKLEIDTTEDMNVSASAVNVNLEANVSFDNTKNKSNPGTNQQNVEEVPQNSKLKLNVDHSHCETKDTTNAEKESLPVIKPKKNKKKSKKSKPDDALLEQNLVNQKVAAREEFPKLEASTSISETVQYRFTLQTFDVAPQIVVAQNVIKDAETELKEQIMEEFFRLIHNMHNNATFRPSVKIYNYLKEINNFLENDDNGSLDKHQVKNDEKIIEKKEPARKIQSVPVKFAHNSYYVTKEKFGFPLFELFYDSDTTVCCYEELLMLIEKPETFRHFPKELIEILQDHKLYLNRAPKRTLKKFRSQKLYKPEPDETLISKTDAEQVVSSLPSDICNLIDIKDNQKGILLQKNLVGNNLQADTEQQIMLTLSKDKVVPTFSSQENLVPDEVADMLMNSYNSHYVVREKYGFLLFDLLYNGKNKSVSHYEEILQLLEKTGIFKDLPEELVGILTNHNIYLKQEPQKTLEKYYLQKYYSQKCSKLEETKVALEPVGSTQENAVNMEVFNRNTNSVLNEIDASNVVTEIHKEMNLAADFPERNNEAETVVENVLTGVQTSNRETEEMKSRNSENVHIELELCSSESNQSTVKQEVSKETTDNEEKVDHTSENPETLKYFPEVIKILKEYELWPEHSSQKSVQVSQAAEELVINHKSKESTEFAKLTKPGTYENTEVNADIRNEVRTDRDITELDCSEITGVTNVPKDSAEIYLNAGEGGDKPESDIETNQNNPKINERNRTPENSEDSTDTLVTGDSKDIVLNKIDELNTDISRDKPDLYTEIDQTISRIYEKMVRYDRLKENVDHVLYESFSSDTTDLSFCSARDDENNVLEHDQFKIPEHSREKRASEKSDSECTSTVMSYYSTKDDAESLVDDLETKAIEDDLDGGLKEFVSFPRCNVRNLREILDYFPGVPKNIPSAMEKVLTDEIIFFGGSLEKILKKTCIRACYDSGKSHDFENCENTTVPQNIVDNNSADDITITMKPEYLVTKERAEIQKKTLLQPCENRMSVKLDEGTKYIDLRNDDKTFESTRNENIKFGSSNFGDHGLSLSAQVATAQCSTDDNVRNDIIAKFLKVSSKLTNNPSFIPSDRVLYHLNEIIKELEKCDTDVENKEISLKNNTNNSSEVTQTNDSSERHLICATIGNTKKSIKDSPIHHKSIKSSRDPFNWDNSKVKMAENVCDYDHLIELIRLPKTYRSLPSSLVERLKVRQIFVKFSRAKSSVWKLNKQKETGIHNPFNKILMNDFSSTANFYYLYQEEKNFRYFMEFRDVYLNGLLFKRKSK